MGWQEKFSDSVRIDKLKENLLGGGAAVELRWLINEAFSLLLQQRGSSLFL
jgi:hypothetical protein